MPGKTLCGLLLCRKAGLNPAAKRERTAPQNGIEPRRKTGTNRAAKRERTAPQNGNEPCRKTGTNRAAKRKRTPLSYPPLNFEWRGKVY